jgi:hypothetical protein
LGGCIIASIHKEELINILELPEHLEILFVLAIGKPKENVLIEEIQPPGDIKYWRDENKNHYVPKRSLNELVYKTWSQE